MDFVIDIKFGIGLLFGALLVYFLMHRKPKG